MSELLIKCPDGFVNQLRLTLAADFLLSIGEARTATQQWILNNHNIVDYDKYFRRMNHLSFEQIDDLKAIKTTSFCSLVSKYGCPKKILRISYNNLYLLPCFEKIVEKFQQKINDDVIGVHLRTGCKSALLKTDNRRYQPIRQESIIQALRNTNKKIYLATDNEETQNKFIDIFKNRIIAFEKIIGGKENFDGEYEPSRVHRYGTDLHVVVDFMILQKCKYFIGSNESSFSIMINWLRNNSLDYMVKGIL